MKKKLTLMYPWIIVLLAMQTLFVKITFSDPSRDPMMELFFKEQETTKNQWIYFSEGLLERTNLMKTIRNSVSEDTFLPQDARLEKTEEKLNRIILSLNTTIIFVIFLISLALSSWYALRKKTWFAPFLSRSFSIFSFFFLLQNLGEKSITVRDPITGSILLIIYLSLIVLSFYIFFTAKRLFNEEETTFLSLKRKMQKQEDDETTHEKDAKEINPTANQFFRILQHFSLILFTGIAAGNILYIPVFTIQKNYSTGFGFILLILLLLLSVFYIQKYNEAGHEQSLNKQENWIASVVFLQYRFLKNSLGITLMILSVILFFTILISLLTLNTSILRDALGVIEKSTEL